MKKYFSSALVCFVLFGAQGLYAQSKATPKHVDLTTKKADENLNVFNQWIRWNNPGSFLINHLMQQAFQYYDIRDKEIAQLNSKSDWIDRQQNVRRKLQEIVGPFPEKTPLNARITGVIKKNGYKVEKIVYESMPGFYVTACLFIPDGIKSKAPAVLNLIGHEQESFRAELDQLIILNLVKKGIVVFTIDPLGQGEHVQYFDRQIKLSSIGYSVIEHCYFGNQCFLTGGSSARYFIWDGIRAIDYLVSRKEIDPARIGVTGFSGGGTITSYLGAFDERVSVAIPSSWSTASRRQLETKGAQDAEAEFYHGLAKGITFEDLIEVRAPKPTLMTFTSQDEYLTLQGAREAYSEIRKAYKAFGQGDNVELVEDDFKHWLTPNIRLAIYKFFMKHFGLPGDPSEQEVELLTLEELRVTSTGQISTSLGGNMVFDVNKKEAEALSQKIVIARKDVNSHLKSVVSKAKVISGYHLPDSTENKAFINGKYQRDGYTVGKYALPGDGNYAIPMLLFVPDDVADRRPAILYLHPDGKIKDASAGGGIEALVKQGYVVAAIDVLGVGETKNTATRGLADGYTAVLIARSIVGIQAGDIVRVVKYLRGRSDVDPNRVGALGFDGMCLPLLHAAAFDASINNVMLVRPLISYRSVATHRMYKLGLTKNEGGGEWHPFEVDFSWGIAGVLTAYDLPDLVGSIAPRKVVMIAPTDHALEVASENLLNEELEFPRTAFASKKASSNLRAVSAGENMTSLVQWCFEK